MSRTTYQIGAGDVLSVNVADFPTLSTQSTVAPDGAISMPLLHQVSVTGLTVRSNHDADDDALQKICD